MSSLHIGYIHSTYLTPVEYGSLFMRPYINNKINKITHNIKYRDQHKSIQPSSFMVVASSNQHSLSIH